MSFHELIQTAPAALWVIYGVALLVVSLVSAIAIAVPTIRRNRSVRDAILAWWPVLIVAGLTCLFGPLLSWLCVVFISLLLQKEALRLLPMGPAQQRFYRRWAALACVAYFGATAFATPFALPALLVLLFLVLPLVHLLRFGTQAYMASVGNLLLIFSASIGMLSFALRILVEPIAAPYSGVGLGLVLFLFVIASDAMQWLGGKLFGKTPLVPSISPKKTWEGLFFGILVCALLGAWKLPVVTGWNSTAGLALGAGFAVFGLLGDLLISAWKRDRGLKDSGTLLPGQGGALDRCDSLIYVAPWFYLLICLAY